jgi:transcriptional regulator with XRE-family HTH domain
MAGLTFRDRLEQEFADRRAINKRYSLRAFAGLLGTDHATVSQILRRKRSVPHERIAAWARKLKLSPEEIAVYTAVERVIDENKRRQSEQLRHWASEMLALLNEPVHREILRLLRRPDFKPDSRWIAAETRAALDHVNIAISRLVGFGLLEMGRAGKWADKTGLAEITPKDFRKYVAERVPNPLLKEGA